MRVCVRRPAAGCGARGSGRRGQGREQRGGQPGRHDGGQGEIDAAVAHPGAQGGGAADRAGERAGAEPGMQTGHGRGGVGLLVGRADGVGAQVDEADGQAVEHEDGKESGEAAGQGEQHEGGAGTGEADRQDRAAAGPVGQRPAGEQGDHAGRGGDGDRGAERRGVQAEAGGQRRELDGPDTDVEAEDAEQAGSRQVVCTAGTGACGQGQADEQPSSSKGIAGTKDRVPAATPHRPACLAKLSAIASGASAVSALRYLCSTIVASVPG